MIDDYNEKGDNTGHSEIASENSQQNRFDEILSALADTHRRYILYYLQEEERASLTSVAQQIAAWKQDRPPAEVQDGVVDDLEIRLYHNHLPRLEDMCLIEYDDRSKQMVFRDPPELVELCLDHCVDRDLPE